MANTAVIVPERSRSDSKHASLLGDNPVGVLDPNASDMRNDSLLDETIIRKGLCLQGHHLPISRLILAVQMMAKPTESRQRRAVL
jgi:hypothetical protein